MGDKTDLFLSRSSELTKLENVSGEVDEDSVWKVLNAKMNC